MRVFGAGVPENSLALKRTKLRESALAIKEASKRTDLACLSSNRLDRVLGSRKGF